MINLGELTYDPDFAQEFDIVRTTGYWGAGGWVNNQPNIITTMGIIQPATEEDLQQVPEGDRVIGSMSFISATEMLHSHTEGGDDPTAGISDKIIWRGNTYRVAGVWPWADYGFWKSVGVRVEGA